MGWSETPLEEITLPDDAANTDARIVIGADDPLIPILNLNAEPALIFYWGDQKAFALQVSPITPGTAGELNFIAYDPALGARQMLSLIADPGAGIGHGTTLKLGDTNDTDLIQMFTNGGTIVSMSGTEVNVQVGGAAGTGVLTIDADMVQSPVTRTFRKTSSTPAPFVGTAAQDVPDLDSIPVKARAQYTYHLHVAYNCAAATDARFNWSVSDPLVTVDRCILAPAATATTNIDTTVESIRRATGTQQQVGGTGGVANAFTVYHEFGVIFNTDTSDHTVTFQVAEAVAGAGVTVQSGSWLKLTRES